MIVKERLFEIWITRPNGSNYLFRFALTSDDMTALAVTVFKMIHDPEIDFDRKDGAQVIDILDMMQHGMYSGKANY